TGAEPWITTSTTTSLLKDILMGSSGSSAALPLAFNSRIFFQASTASSFPSDNELWSTTGVPTTGTTRFKDICTGTCSGNPHGLITLNTAAGLRLLFAASPIGDFSNESLYVSDGTSGATAISIFSGGSVSSLTVSGSLAYFIDFSNKRLYVTDGTMAGTNVITNYGSAGF